jgi:hypothetical protein
VNGGDSQQQAVIPVVVDKASGIEGVTVVQLGEFNAANQLFAKLGANTLQPATHIKASNHTEGVKSTCYCSSVQPVL